MNHSIFIFQCNLVFTLAILSGWLIVNQSIFADVLSVGSKHTCAIQTDNTVICWGYNRLNQASPPIGTFSQVDAGSTSYTCGIRTDKTVACWGDNKYGQATPPSGTFTQISTGYYHTCGVRTDKTVACWGKNEEEDYGQYFPPNDELFLSVGVGKWHSCGLRIDNTVVCWGSNKDPFRIPLGNQANPPDGTFLQISVGKFHNCGIRIDNTVVCWGVDSDGGGDMRGVPPNDMFSQVSAGHIHTCGIRTDKTVACWGWNEASQASAPNSICEDTSHMRIPPNPTPHRPLELCYTSLDRTFFSISAGLGGERTSHSCGVQTDNTVICWGYNGDGQATPPPCFEVKSSGSQTVESLAYGILYGVHTDGKKDSQFFTLDSRILEANPFGELYENYDLAAIDSNPLTYQIFAVSGEKASQKGYLYQVDRKKGLRLLELGKTGFKKVAGISFHPDGTLWGWAQDAGLFKIENDENNEPDINQTELVLPYQGEVKIEDLTWNATGTTLYAVENLYDDEEEEAQKSDEPGTLTKAKGVRLWAYTQTGTISTVCDKDMNSLEEEIEAMETLPGDNDTLLFHFSGHENLTFGIMDVQTCQIVQKEIPTSYYAIEREPKNNYFGVRNYNNIKSLAWIACQP